MIALVPAIRRRLEALAGDRSGVTVVEFAMVAPALLLTILGIFDLGYNMYTQTLLQGAIQKSARDSTIEGALDNETAIDSRVSDAVHRIVPSASVVFDRRAYSNFSQVGQPEDYTDTNGDGSCNNGEPFEDANGNGSWDADRGNSGMGGARDAVLYTVTATYPRAFPLAAMIGLPENVSTEATTVLRNQPFSDQENETTIGQCT